LDTEYEKTFRYPMISQTRIIWNLSESKILKSIEALKANSLSRACQEKIEMSYNAFEDIIVDLTTSRDYHNEEDPVLFKRAIEELKDVFKHLLEAYMLERSLQLSGDNIDVLRDEFYKDIEHRRGISRPNFLSQAYPPITSLVRLVRNCHHAAIGKVDHITGKRGFGNVYTLCSAFILSIYAYIEILEIWEETERVYPRQIPSS
jgi:hypothetical protein